MSSLFFPSFILFAFFYVQDVRAFTGQLSNSGQPLIRLERAAMIHFGVPSFGVHLNGFVRATGEDHASRILSLSVLCRLRHRAFAL